VGWLRQDSALWFEPGGAEVVVPLGQARALAVDGESLLALGQDGLQVLKRVDAAGAVESFKTYLAISPQGVVRMFADGERAWVVGGKELLPVELRLEREMLAVGPPIGLPAESNGRTQVDVTRTAGGDFVHVIGRLLTRITPAGASSRLELAGDFPDLIVLAGGPAGDRAWASLAAGGLALLDLTPPRVALCAALQPDDHLVHALAAGVDEVAAVLVRQASTADDPAWSLAVFGLDGRQLMRVALPWQPARSQFPDLSVAVAAGRVAVASATRVVVWELATQRVLVDRGP